MASEESNDSGSASAVASSTANSSESKPNTNGSGTGVTTENLKSGWLTKRTKLSHKWEKRWFQLRSNMLHYGNDAQVLKVKHNVKKNLNKCIPLDGTEIAEADTDHKQFVFRLKPSQGRRTYYLHTASQEELQEWMQAICFAKAASHHGDSSQACCIQ